MGKRIRKKWTDEEIASLVIKKVQGKEYGVILKELRLNHPNGGFEDINTYHLGHKWKEINRKSQNRYTQKEVDFVYACMLNNFSHQKIIAGFKEQFNKDLNSSDIVVIIKKRRTKLRVKYEDDVEAEIASSAQKLKKEVNKMNIKRGQWTTKENKKLMKCNNRQEVIALAIKLNRSQNSAYVKWYNARKAVSLVKMTTKTPNKGRMSKAELEMIRNSESIEEALALNLRKPETIKRHYAAFHGTLLSKENREKSVKILKKTTKPKKKYSPRWTIEEEYDLVCNFYELSIDQARNRFNRPYGVIATRLEKIVDSTQPRYQALLMKASKEIKSRKQAESKPVKMSRKERRKAKREAKILKRMARLQSQLTED